MEIRKLSKSEFPEALAEIPKPPEDLWIIGSVPKGCVFLTVVGSRKNTSYGKEACEKLLGGLKGYPISIVSGFAMGIDTIAHNTALRSGLPTVVFPGSGLSFEAIYPKANTRMMREIVESGGCLLSEFEPDFKATMWAFPMRNRLMAGLSRATLVIEAAEKSGTLITARLALDYNRDLLAVPGQIFSPAAAGTNKLIRQGAMPVTCPEDILEALGFERPKKQETLFRELSPEEESIVKLLAEPRQRDDLARLSGMSISDANVLLSIMEVKGLIKEEYGEISLVG